MCESNMTEKREKVLADYIVQMVSSAMYCQFLSLNNNWIFFMSLFVSDLPAFAAAVVILFV